MISNKERLKKYRKRMEAAGFKRLSFYAAPELVVLINEERKKSECGGRTLERLLLGQSLKRPDYYTNEERPSKGYNSSYE